MNRTATLKLSNGSYRNSAPEPEASNFRIGARSDASHAIGIPGLTCDGGSAKPQRSPIHTLAPSRSMSTALVDHQLRPAGSFAQFSIEV